MYFNDRKGALVSVVTFFAVNLAVTAWSIHSAPLYYGIGLVAGGVCMYMVSFPRLLMYVRQIDYHVFCGQPVLASREVGPWTRLANQLDAHITGRVNRKGGRARA